jgi:hypothetical protein
MDEAESIEQILSEVNRLPRHGYGLTIRNPSARTYSPAARFWSAVALAAILANAVPAVAQTTKHEDAVTGSSAAFEHVMPDSLVKQYEYLVKEIEHISILIDGTDRIRELGQEIYAAYARVGKEVRLGELERCVRAMNGEFPINLTGSAEVIRQAYPTNAEVPALLMPFVEDLPERVSSTNSTSTPSTQSSQEKPDSARTNASGLSPYGPGNIGKMFLSSDLIPDVRVPSFQDFVYASSTPPVQRSTSTGDTSTPYFGIVDGELFPIYPWPAPVVNKHYKVPEIRASPEAAVADTTVSPAPERPPVWDVIKALYPIEAKLEKSHDDSLIRDAYLASPMQTAGNRQDNADVVQEQSSLSRLLQRGYVLGQIVNFQTGWFANLGHLLRGEERQPEPQVVEVPKQQIVTVPEIIRVTERSPAPPYNPVTACGQEISSPVVTDAFNKVVLREDQWGVVGPDGNVTRTIDYKTLPGEFVKEVVLYGGEKLVIPDFEVWKDPKLSGMNCRDAYIEITPDNGQPTVYLNNGPVTLDPEKLGLVGTSGIIKVIVPCVKDGKEEPAASTPAFYSFHAAPQQPCPECPETVKSVFRDREPEKKAWGSLPTLGREPGIEDRVGVALEVQTDDGLFKRGYNSVDDLNGSAAMHLGYRFSEPSYDQGSLDLLLSGKFAMRNGDYTNQGDRQGNFHDKHWSVRGLLAAKQGFLRLFAGGGYAKTDGTLNYDNGNFPNLDVAQEESNVTGTIALGAGNFQSYPYSIFDGNQSGIGVSVTGIAAHGNETTTYDDGGCFTRPYNAQEVRAELGARWKIGFATLLGRAGLWNKARQSEGFDQESSGYTWSGGVGLWKFLAELEHTQQNNNGGAHEDFSDETGTTFRVSVPLYEGGSQ